MQPSRRSGPINGNHTNSQTTVVSITGSTRRNSVSLLASGVICSGQATNRNTDANNATSSANRDHNSEAPNISLFYQLPPFTENIELQTPEIVICSLLGNLPSRIHQNPVEARWILEYLSRYQDAIKTPQNVRQILVMVASAVDGWHMPNPCERDVKALSTLVAKFCCDFENNKECVQTFVSICNLINRWHSILECPILSQEVQSLLIRSVFVRLSFQDMPEESLRAILNTLNVFAKQLILEDFTPEVVTVLVSLIILCTKRDTPKKCDLPVMTCLKQVSGIMNEILLHEEITLQQRFRLCIHWSHPEIRISLPARMALCRLMKEVVLYSKNPPEDPEVNQEDFKFELRKTIAEALMAFGTLVKDAHLSPLSENEVLTIVELMDIFVGLPPKPECYNIAMAGMACIVQTTPLEHLAPLFSPITILLGNASVNITLLRLLRPDAPGFEILRLIEQKDQQSQTCHRVARELTQVLRIMVEETTNEFPFIAKVATVFYIGGLLVDYPIQVEILDNLKASLVKLMVAEGLSTAEDAQLQNITGLMCQLFAHFVDQEPDLLLMSYAVVGLSRLAAHKAFLGFSPEAVLALELLLERVIDYEPYLNEDVVDEEAEIIVGLSTLAELGLLPHFNKDPEDEQSSFDDMVGNFLVHLNAISNPDHPIIFKSILALGKFAENQRIARLEVHPQSILLSKIFGTSSWELTQSPEEDALEKFADFIHALGWLHQSDQLIITEGGVQQILINTLLVKSLLDSVIDRLTVRQMDKILFALKALQKAANRNVNAGDKPVSLGGSKDSKQEHIKRKMRLLLIALRLQERISKNLPELERDGYLPVSRESRKRKHFGGDGPKKPN